MEIRTRDILIIGVIVMLFFSLWPNPEEVSESETEEEVYVEEVEDGALLHEVKKEIAVLPVSVKPTMEFKKPPPARLKKSKYPNLDESFAAFDEQGNLYIEQVTKVGQHLVYHGDVLIGDVSDLPKLMKSKVIKVGKSPRWPGGRIPYVIDESVAQSEKVVEAIEYLNTFTNIKIVPRENETDFVFVTRGEEDCYSYAGRKGGRQEIFVVPQCGIRELIHEWMHTIGFLHEQNREDRDQYVQIVWENIDEINHPQFKKLPNDFMGVVSRPFDYQSIMLYSSEVFSQHPGEPALLTVNGDIIPRTENLLSDEDILRINLAYPLQ